MLAALALGSLIVNITIDQAGGLTAAQRQTVVAAMAEIWRTAGVEVRLQQTDQSPLPTEASVSLRIVTFAAMPKSRKEPDEPILAWAVGGPAATIEPAIFVSLPTVASFLVRAEYGGYPVRKLPNKVQDRLLALAVGRAAAHELGHYLLQRAGHRDRGLMRPSYTANDLIGPLLATFQLAAPERFAALLQIEEMARAQHATHP